MADNFSTPIPGGTLFAADEVGGKYHQRVKLSVGSDGSADDVDASHPLHVAATAPLPVDLQTSSLAAPLAATIASNLNRADTSTGASTNTLKVTPIDTTGAIVGRRIAVSDPVDAGGASRQFDTAYVTASAVGSYPVYAVAAFTTVMVTNYVLHAVGGAVVIELVESTTGVRAHYAMASGEKVIVTGSLSGPVLTTRGGHGLSVTTDSVTPVHCTFNYVGY